MKKIAIAFSLLCLSSTALADTLYQADSSYGASIGYGFAGNPAYSATVNMYGGNYTPSVSASGVPYDTFTYPYSSGCCGCNSCNNCGSSYSTRCR